MKEMFKLRKENEELRKENLFLKKQRHFLQKKSVSWCLLLLNKAVKFHVKFYSYWRIIVIDRKSENGECILPKILPVSDLRNYNEVLKIVG